MISNHANSKVVMAARSFTEKKNAVRDLSTFTDTRMVWTILKVSLLYLMLGTVYFTWFFYVYACGGPNLPCGPAWRIPRRVHQLILRHARAAWSIRKISVFLPAMSLPIIFHIQSYVAQES